MPKLTLLFVRHGETQDNIDRVLQGWHDTPLTEKGIREARIMADQLKSEHIDALYHSPLQRMVQTVQPILDAHPNLPVYADPDLRGQGLGDLEGGSYDSVNLNDPRSADSNPTVEKFDDFVARLKRAMGRIIGQQAPLASSKSADRTVVVATHGVGTTSIFKTLESTPECHGLNPVLAVRGPKAFEVRVTDSDDVCRLVVEKPEELPVREGRLEWERIEGKPFLIEYWGKEEKVGRKI